MWVQTISGQVRLTGDELRLTVVKIDLQRCEFRPNSGQVGLTEDEVGLTGGQVRLTEDVRSD